MGFSAEWEKFIDRLSRAPEKCCGIELRMQHNGCADTLHLECSVCGKKILLSGPSTAHNNTVATKSAKINALEGELAKLNAMVNAMKCCANCRHAHYDGMDYECYADIHGITGDCCQPDLELWELETKGGKKP